MVSLQVGNIPVPYEACFSIYSNLFNMQKFMSQSAISNASTQYTLKYWKITMLLTHGKYPAIRNTVSFSMSHVPAKIEYIFLQTCGIPVEKVRSSLFVVP